MIKELSYLLSGAKLTFEAILAAIWYDIWVV